MQSTLSSLSIELEVTSASRRSQCRGFNDVFANKILPGLDLSLTVENLLNERHVEFGPFYGESIGAIGRGASGSVAWRFRFALFTRSVNNAFEAADYAFRA